MDVRSVVVKDTDSLTQRCLALVGEFAVDEPPQDAGLPDAGAADNQDLERLVSPVLRVTVTARPSDARGPVHHLCQAIDSEPHALQSNHGQSTRPSPSSFHSQSTAGAGSPYWPDDVGPQSVRPTVTGVEWCRALDWPEIISTEFQSYRANLILLYTLSSRLYGDYTTVPEKILLLCVFQAF